ncbi:MAG TPA: BatA domain-containing protein [Gemmatimonadales bacterium]|nr:BatA domain-containing protein [Gemmatimonadales bacterium]
MTFLHPLALLGLAAAAIPALLHLLERRVPPEAEFPPIRYLSEAERQNARRLKLRHLLLLILRTALIALIALAAARPLVPSRSGGAGAAGGAGTHEPAVLTVILDNSPSSGLVVDGRPTLDRLKVVARASIASAGPGDRLWLMLADGVARAGPREELLATLDGAQPAAQRLDLTAAVARAARLVDAEPLPAREVHVVSDLQRTAFGEGRVDVPRGVRVLALAPAGSPPSNRGIAAARLAGGALAVTAAGTSGAAPASVAMRLRGRDAGRALVVPGASVSIPLPAIAPGWWLGEVALDPDELRADDRRLFAWRVAPPARVRGEPGAGPFLSAALAVLAEGMRVAAVAEGSAGGPADVSIGERPQSGAGQSVVLPPADPALVGPANRALAARGVRWRFGALGTPGPIAAESLLGIGGIPVIRRYHLEVMGKGDDPRGRGDDAAVLATVNGEPWLARDGDVVLLGSRLDTAWTALPAAPAFVPFVDALVNRLTRGDMPVVEREGAPRVEFRTRGTDTVGAIVYGPDPRESDLTPAAADLVRRAIGADVLDDAQFAAERFAGTRRLDVSGLLLALALILAAVELGVATLTH